MKKIIYLIVLLPLGVVLIVLSVANREPVTLRLDPFNDVNPALSATWPFFAFLFAALLVGMVLGAVVTWFGQYRHRAGEKRYQAEVRQWRDEAEKQRKRADDLAMNLAAGQPSSQPAPRPAGASLPAPGNKAA